MADEWKGPMAEIAELSVTANRLFPPTRAVKGGSWQDSAYWARPAIVAFREPDCPSPTIGFRCASDPLP